MSYKDISIKCQGFWMGGMSVSPELKSFFNTSYTPGAYTELLELADFLTADSELNFEYEIENVDTEKESIKLFNSSSVVSLQLSNVKPIRQGFYLFNYFGFDNPPYSTEIKFKVVISYKGKNIFQGVIDQSTLQFANPNEVSERELITFQIFSWEKEFKDYFSNKEMPDSSSMLWVPFFENGNYNECPLAALQQSFFGEGLRYKFDAGFNHSKPLSDWMMSKNPKLTVAPDSANNHSRIWTVFNGYNYIKSNLNLSRFDFWKKLCNAMGWVFYFTFPDHPNYVHSNEIHMFTRNRVTSELFYKDYYLNYKLTFDINSLIDYNVLVSPFSHVVKTIKLSVIEAFGGDQAFYNVPKLKGPHDIFFSWGGDEPTRNLLHFEKLYAEGDNAYPEASHGYEHSKTMSTDGDNTNAVNIIYNGTIRKNFYYKNDSLMEIDGGHNGFSLNRKQRMNFDKRNEVTDYHPGDNISEYDYIYSGNIGDAMIWSDTPSNCTQYCTTVASDGYNYTKSEQFNMNIRALLSSKENSILEITVNGFYPYPSSVINFTSSTGAMNYVFQGTFDVISLEADAINEITKFKIRRRNV